MRKSSFISTDSRRDNPIVLKSTDATECVAEKERLQASVTDSRIERIKARIRDLQRTVDETALRPVRKAGLVQVETIERLDRL
jgi:hypothetical protein